MRLGHVRRRGRVAAAHPLEPGVGGDPLDAVEHLHGVRGEAHVQRPADQPGRNRVEVRVDLNVIVDSCLGLSKIRQLEPDLRQRYQ